MDAASPAALATTAALLLSAVAIAFLFLLRWRQKTFDFFRGTGISGPPPSIFSGHFYQLWQENTVEVIDEWFKKYGEIYGIFNGDAPFVMVKDIELLRRVFVSDFGQFVDRGTVWRSMNDNPAFRNSISIARAERWKAIRRCISPAFTANKLRAFVPGMVEAVGSFLEILDERSVREGPSGGQIDVRPYLNTLAFDLVARTTFGMRLDVQKNTSNPLFVHATSVLPGTLATLFRTAAQLFSDVKGCVPLMLTLERWFGYDAFQSLADCSIPAIKMRRNDSTLTRPDLLQCMLEMEFHSTHIDVSGFHWTEEERELHKGKEKVVMPIKDIATNAANMLQAGFETVGVTLSHCLFCIAKFQAVQDKIRAETEAALAKHGQFSYDAISDLQYTAQTIMETLRMYTPAIAFTTRRASADYRYENVLLREGVSVMACSHQVHHDPNLWERPDEFDPERFSSEQRASRDPLAFQAFGVGPRNCVGMKLAQLEMALVVAKLVHRFRLHLGSKHVNGELKRHTYSIIACPADGVWIRLEKLMRGS
ncbi:cytochrome P450 3A24-like isoform X3 [Dermacentor andersoni]|uniref:cytochrome P450 3A24-like isoform X3 n=2 Tax=Dermacentor andersoni TaxID=34620 RepID=UPI0021559522|nr:cytochrome P450 3A24-like isoform X1 [Dermacentor andersoni]